MSNTEDELEEAQDYILSIEGDLEAAQEEAKQLRTELNKTERKTNFLFEILTKAQVSEYQHWEAMNLP